MLLSTENFAPPVVAVLLQQGPGKLFADIGFESIFNMGQPAVRGLITDVFECLQIDEQG